MSVDLLESRRPKRADPVADWKRAVRESLVREEAGEAGVDLRISPGFVVLAGGLGLPGGPAGVVTTGVVLLSALLAQELPRAVFARACGRSARIELSALGGRIVLSGSALRGASAFAYVTLGTVANLGIALVAFTLSKHVAAGPARMLAGVAFVHTYWGLAQVLPIVPLRAGRELAERLRPPARLAQAAFSLLAVVVVGSLLARRSHSPLLAAMFVLVIVATCLKDFWAAYCEVHDGRSGATNAAAEAEAWLRAGNPVRAATVAKAALSQAHSVRLRMRLYKALAWAGIGREDPVQAHVALLQLPAEAVDLHLLAAYLSACGRRQEALSLLEEARSNGQRAPETTRLLIDLLIDAERMQAALAVALEDWHLLGNEDQEVLARALGPVLQAALARAPIDVSMAAPRASAG